MNQAFYNSGIEKIQFAGSLDNVVSAIDAFQNCFMLEDMPNVLYKKIKHGKRLVSDFDGDYSAIFNGCDRLIRKLRSTKRDKDRQNEPGDRFDDEIARIQAFYEDGKHLAPMLDSRGYIVVRTQDDAESAVPILSRRDVKGIVIDKNAKPEELFYKLNLRIKSLDLNGVKSTAGMFTKCNILEFGEIIGGENVIDARGMFEDTSCNRYPPMNFPKLSAPFVFYDAKCPVDIPRIQYAQTIQDLPDLDINLERGLPDNAREEAAQLIL